MRKKSVSIELGGKTRELKMNLNALAAYEERTGKSLLTIQQDLQSFSSSALRAMLWAMLLTDEKDLAIETVGEWIDLNNLRDVAEKLVAAMKLTMPKPEAEAAEQASDPLAQ